MTIQRIAIKLFHINHWSFLQLKKLTQGIRWGFFDISFFNIIATSGQMNLLVLFIWISKVSTIPWIQSFLEWDSICIRWHPSPVSVIPNMKLSLLTKSLYHIFPFSWEWKLVLFLSDSSFSLLLFFAMI